MKYNLVVVFGVLFLSSGMHAQEVTGSIVGSVVDASGAAIPGAEVKLSDTDRGLAARTMETDSDGNFTATLLPIGNYSIRVAARGFKPLAKSGIELHVSDRLTLRLELTVGDVSQEVTVEETVVGVELGSPVSGGLISGTEIRELSLNNRNYVQLISLMPGVSSNAASDEIYIGTTNPTGGTNTIPFSMNGGRNSGNNFMVDGADNVDRGSNLTLLNYPSVDAIAEFKALRGQYSAEFGRGASGMVNVITKSGTMKWHGSAYEFNRNDLLAANNYFNNLRNINRPPLRYNNFGYTFSGPVPLPGYQKRETNKTFFFWSQEFRRVITYATFNGLAPTEDMKRGKFAQPVCIDFTVNTCNATATEIGVINPVARQYIDAIWSKLPAGDPTTFNLFTPQRSIFNARQELIKVDHVFNARHQISVRYMHDTIPTEEPGGLFTGAALPGVSTTKTDSPGRNWTLRMTSNLSPTVLNEAGYSDSYGAIVSRPIGLIGSAASSIKTPLPFPSTLGRAPSLSVSGLSSVTGFGPYDDFNYNRNIFDNVTKIYRKHVLKTGVAINFYRKIENAAGNNAGTFAIPSTPRPTGTSIANQGWANFLLGTVSSFTQASLDLTPDMRQRQFEAYLQDDYRLRPNLTVNLGVRYSNFRSPFDAFNRLTNFDPALFDPAKAPQINPVTGNIVPGTGDELNGIAINGKNSRYGDKVTNDGKGVFAPRVGFAWDPFGKGKTAIRSGYGISYDSTLVGIYEQSIFNNPPFVNSVTISNTRLENPTAGAPVISLAPKALRGTPVPNQLPYTQQWSLDVQHQIGRVVMSVGYFGQKSTHLLGVVDINQVRPGAGVAAGLTTADRPFTTATTPLLNALRPFRGYNAINQVQNWFNANYNAVQASLMARMPGGGSVRLSYTFSKTLTDATSDRSNAPQNFYDRSLEYARANFDRTQVFTGSYIYDLPIAKSAKGLTGSLLRGWKLSGIVALNTGLPLRVTSSYGFDWAGLGILGSSASAVRPDRFVPNANENLPKELLRWFDTSAFGPVPAGTVRQGNAPATSINGPGAARIDFSMFKSFRLRERASLQTRFETFNLTNHTNYQGVSAAMGSTNIGQVTSTRDPRRLQLAAKLTF